MGLIFMIQHDFFVLKNLAASIAHFAKSADNFSCDFRIFKITRVHHINLSKPSIKAMSLD